jgi:tetratricopeptide (TPR) repeat protein
MQPQKQLATLGCLQEKDFSRFYSSFKEVVEHKLSSFKNLFFLQDLADVQRNIESPVLVDAIKKYFTTGQSRSAFYYSNIEGVVVTITAEKRNILAVITGVDPYFADHVSMDWLADFSKTLEYSFLLVKRGGTDLDTGLLNSQQFYLSLEKPTPKEKPSLLLVELYPRARSSRESRMHSARAARSLRSCLGEKCSLFYMGHHLFAVVTTMEQNDFAGVGRKVLSWLRRDGFRKVHIGLRWTDLRAADTMISANPVKIVEQALLALAAARKRGPISLCDYQRIHHPENHPLRKPSTALLAKMRRRWRGVEAFAIVLLRPSASCDSKLLTEGLTADMVCDNGDIFLFLPNTAPLDALQWIKEEITALLSRHVQIGVSSYPYASFSKTETVFNCRKALHHAGFFGPAGCAIFDAVSLNISGDIYYAEGNLTSAVKEYKHGLICDPEDANLLNSLGVAYADMDKHREARYCFERALLLDCNNFMALYNAGMGAELTGHTAEAIDYFEKAFQLDTEFAEVQDDLAFRLGRLYCLSGKFSEAVKTLLPWHQKEEDGKSKERGLAYLGRAYHGLGCYEEAMRWLQKALTYNEFDAESMGLLGHIYLIRKEGDDIALTLCEKSVDLEPKNLQLKLYLARAQIACGYYEEARRTIDKCLRNRAYRAEAQLLACRNDKEEGLLKKAKHRLEKLLQNDHLDKEIVTQAYIIKEEIDGI